LGRRSICISEPESGLSVRARLLDDEAPLAAAALWSLARLGDAHDALHAMWTGPEISCPVPAARLPVDLAALSVENGTTHPAAGEVVLVALLPGAWPGLPPGGALDIGLFYADGGRLLMPGGWVTGSVAARVEPADLEALASGGARIRQRGACRLRLETVA
jgi:hypothetical protein